LLLLTTFLLCRCTGADQPKPHLDWIAIHGGWFWMGCKPGDNACWSNELPQHAVKLDAFAMARRPVTLTDYRMCVDAGSCRAPDTTSSWCSGANARYNGWITAGSSDRPVNCVTWSDARAFCGWIGAHLPSEAQWEMAARGACFSEPDAACRAAMRTWPWGETPATCERAVMADENGAGCGEDRIWPVGSRPAGRSPEGLDDMAGNVWEWTADWHDLYTSVPTTNPDGPKGGVMRVIRGGAFHEVSEHLRSSLRGTADPDVPYRSVGFRCVR